MIVLRILVHVKDLTKAIESETKRLNSLESKAEKQDKKATKNFDSAIDKYNKQDANKNGVIDDNETSRFKTNSINRKMRKVMKLLINVIPLILIMISQNGRMKIFHLIPPAMLSSGRVLPPSYLCRFVFGTSSSVLSLACQKGCSLASLRFYDKLLFTPHLSFVTTIILIYSVHAFSADIHTHYRYFLL